MTQITLNLPDDLISRLSSVKEQIPHIIELGLRELNATSQIGFKGSAEILEFLASLPTSEEIIALRPNNILQQHQYLEHLVRMAKAKAFLKLKQEDKNE